MFFAIDIIMTMKKTGRHFEIRDNILMLLEVSGMLADKPGDGNLGEGPQRPWMTRWWYKSAIKMPR